MSSQVTSPKAAVVPTMRYRDPGGMAKWLCEAFGFEQQLVVHGRDGGIVLAQLKYGDSLVMLNPIHESTIDKLMAQPDEVGGVETQSCYILVDDIDRHCARAKAAGAEIMFDMDIKFESLRNKGGRGYVCRDPEGHIWSFGTYDPWQEHAARAAAQKPVPRPSRGRHVLAGMLAVVALASAAAWSGYYPDPPTILQHVLSGRSGTANNNVAEGQAGRGLADDVEMQIAALRTARDKAEKSTKDLSHEIARERTARERAERIAIDAANRLAQEREMRSADERAASAAARQLDDERAARIRAELQAKEASEQLGRMTAARQAAERLAKEASEQLQPERNARVAAELAANELRNEVTLLRQGQSPERYRDLRAELEAERNAKVAAEQTARIMQQQLAQEHALREAAERNLKRTQDQLSTAPAPPSCWTLPEATCRAPQVDLH